MQDTVTRAGTPDIAVPEFMYGFYRQCLRESFEQFGSILSLPIIGDPYAEARRHYTGGKVLDIGAGNAHPVKRAFAGALAEGDYFSLDTDPQGTFDFTSVQQIPRDLTFELIVANQVFEHLDIDTSLEIMAHAAAHLAPAGRIFVTVPNVAHPNRFTSDITHVTHWGHHSVYMLLKAAGLTVERMARYSKYHPRGPIERLLARYIGRIYRMDWCDSVLVQAVKNA